MGSSEAQRPKGYHFQNEGERPCAIDTNNLKRLKETKETRQREEPKNSSLFVDAQPSAYHD
jgi:hypothetical protein